MANCKIPVVQWDIHLHSCSMFHCHCSLMEGISKLFRDPPPKRKLKFCLIADATEGNQQILWCLILRHTHHSHIMYGTNGDERICIFTTAHIIWQRIQPAKRMLLVWTTWHLKKNVWMTRFSLDGFKLHSPKM